MNGTLLDHNDTILSEITEQSVGIKSGNCRRWAIVLSSDASQEVL